MVGENFAAEDVPQKVNRLNRKLLRVACVTAMLFAVLFVLAGSTSADVSLSWTPGTISWDPTTANYPTTWRIYRRTFDQPLALLSEVAALTYNADGSVAGVVQTAIDTTVTLGTEYCYQVSGWNPKGESPTSNEACAMAIDNETIALQIPAGRIPLVSRLATDGSQIVSILTNKSDVVSVNDSQAAPGATIVMGVPSGKTTLVSKLATDGSQLFSILVNHSQVLFINGLQK